MNESINWRRELRKAIEAGFDDNELQTLCFDLEIKYESLSGDNFSGKVRELIEYFERKKRLPELIAYCKEKLERVPWDEIEAAAAAAEREEAAAAVSEEKVAAAPILPPTKSSQPWQLVLSPQTIAIAVIGILVVIGGIYLLVRSLRPETTTAPAVADVPATQTVSATAVPATTEATDEPILPATEAPPTATKVPPTATNEPTAEPTIAPTVEEAVEAEATAELSVEVTAEAEPTVLYPDGRPLELTYDPTSFYLYNPSSERVPVRNLSFEALDDAGRPLIYGMAGDRWTQFYNFVDGLACDSIEPFGVGGVYLQPQFCRSYNSKVTPEKNGDELFWIERPGSVEFRVLWDGEEIARCPLGTNTCKLFVPAP